MDGRQCFGVIVYVHKYHVEFKLQNKIEAIYRLQARKSHWFLKFLWQHIIVVMAWTGCYVAVMNVVAIL